MRRSALVLLIALLLSGCATIPDRGSVQAGSTAPPPSDDIQFLGDRPEPGDDPRSIVQGFLGASTAGLSRDVDFEVARSYLTPEANARWRPLERVVVSATASSQRIDVESVDPVASAGATDTSEDPREAGSAVARVSMEAVGQVDERGVYAAAGADVTSEMLYDLVLVEGEWRIADLPEGLLLSEVTFNALFEAVPLAFWTQDQTMLVPDVRYVPQRNAATYALGHLVAGPSPWLANAVTTAFAGDVVLEPGSSVQIENGTAQVRLSAATGTDARSRGVAYRQIERTLLALSEIRDVDLVFGGTPYEPQGAPLPVEPPGAGRLVGISDGELVEVDAGEQVPALAQQAAVPDLRSPAPGYTEESGIAALSGTSSLVLLTGDGLVRTLAQAPELAPPSQDRFGWIWSASGSSLIAASVDGETLVPDADWVGQQEIVSIRISREGTRAAVLLLTSTGARVVVAAVLRDEAGAPTSLVLGPEALTASTRLRSLAWVDQTSIAALAVAGETGVTSVRTFTVAGTTGSASLADTATSITGADGQVVVGTASQRLLVRSGARWDVVAEGVSDPAYPG